MITGAPDGIGASADRLLKRANPADRIVTVGRNPDKTKAAADGGRYFTADYADLSPLRDLAAQLVALANNAGGMFDGLTITDDDWELTWQVNVVAPFLLTSLLRPQLTGSIVNTSSMTSSFMSRFAPDDMDSRANYNQQRAYGNAKVGVSLMTRYFHVHGIPSVAFHPGVIATNFGGNSTGSFSKLYALKLAKKVMASPDDGGKVLAQFIAGQPGVHWDSGYYYGSPTRKGITKRSGRGNQLARRGFDDIAARENVEWSA